MALTLLSPQTLLDGMGERVEGDRRYFFGTILLDSAYPAGGYSFQAGLFGMNTVESIIPSITVSGGVTIMTLPILTNGVITNLKMENVSTAVELANNTNLSGVSIDIMVVGV